MMKTIRDLIVWITQRNSWNVRHVSRFVFFFSLDIRRLHHIILLGIIIRTVLLLHWNQPSRADRYLSAIHNEPGRNLKKLKLMKKNDCLPKYNGLVNENRHLWYGYYEYGMHKITNLVLDGSRFDLKVAWKMTENNKWPSSCLHIQDNRYRTSRKWCQFQWL